MEVTFAKTPTYADLDTALIAIPAGSLGSFKAYSYGVLDGAGSDDYIPRRFDIFRNDDKALVVTQEYAPSRLIHLRRT
jgi:hypothetical protein